MIFHQFDTGLLKGDISAEIVIYEWNKKEPWWLQNISPNSLTGLFQNDEPHSHLLKGRQDLVTGF